MTWPWNLYLPLAFGLTSVLIAVGFVFQTTLGRRILVCLISPVVASFTVALLHYFFDPQFHGSFYDASFIFGMSFIWSCIAIPCGVVLGFISRLIVSAFTPYEPFKSDKKAE